MCGVLGCEDEVYMEEIGEIRERQRERQGSKQVCIILQLINFDDGFLHLFLIFFKYINFPFPLLLLEI